MEEINRLVKRIGKALMARFTEDELNSVRRIDLAAWLIANRPDIVEREGQSLRLKSNRSVSIKAGWSGWYDFSSGQGGDAIDLLTKELGYSFADAVRALSGGQALESSLPSMPAKPFELPPAGGDIGAVISYLMRRGLNQEIIAKLIEWGLLYASPGGYGLTNAVFVNANRTYWELRGTTGTKFCRSGRKDSERYWYFPSPGVANKPKTAFVCESAIDAVSLYLLHREPAFYCSIGGVTNKGAIDAISWTGLETVLAVDADEAGDKCRAWARTKGLAEGIKPKRGKDWNEALQRRVGLTHGH